MRTLTLFTFIAILAAQAQATILAPTNFRTDPSDFSGNIPGIVTYQFRWTDNATNETGYQVEVSTNGIDFYLEAIKLANATGYDTAFIPYTSNRWYRIRAVNASEQSSYAGPVKCYGYFPPTGLAGSTISTNQMTITWNKSGGIVDGYYVQQDTNSSFNSVALTQYFVSGSNTVSYTINTNFILNTVYYFRVVSTYTPANTGSSEANNKPVSYIACAPNGPPVAPLFIDEGMKDAAGTSRIIFQNQSLNALGYTLEFTTNGSTWYQVGETEDDTQPPRYIKKQSGLTGGMTYSYRASNTNLLGASPYAIWQFTPPLSVATGPTVWYVDKAAAGNSSGTNWANAWNSLGSINWSSLLPGHTVYIADGSYTNYITTWTGGSFGNPILLKATNYHGGRTIITGQIVYRSDYVTIDGSINSSLTNIAAEYISQNINMEIVGIGDSNETGISTPRAIGCVAKWVEIHNLGSPTTPDGLGCGVLVTPTDYGPTNCEFSFLYIHDVFGDYFDHGIGTLYKPNQSGAVFHHIFGEYCHDNFASEGGGIDVHDCYLRNWKSPGVAHPDCIQGSLMNLRLWNNRFVNWCSSGSAQALYGDIGDNSQTNLVVINNLFACDHNDSQLTMLNDNPGPALYLVNVSIIGNTFYGETSVSFGVVNNGKTNVYLQNWRVENNLFYSGTNCDAGQGSFSTGGTFYDPTNLIFDFNVLCGNQKKFLYRTNTSYPDVFLFTSAEQFNTWGSYKSNSSTQVNLVREYFGDYSLFGVDTVANSHGTNLSALSSLLSAITNDLIGTPRKWSIGAYEPDPALMFYGDDETFTNARGSKLQDLSGHGNYAVAVTNATKTLVWSNNYCPGSIAGIAGKYALNFVSLGTNEHWQVYTNDPGYNMGTWLVLTNQIGLDHLSNGTFCCWVNEAGTNGFGSATLFDSRNLGVDNTFYISRYPNGSMSFVWITNGTEQVAIRQFTEPAPGAWYHVAYAWNAANNTVVGYTNGVPYQTNAMHASEFRLNPNVNIATIGVMSFGLNGQIGGGEATPEHPNNGWLQGYLDEFRIYNRDLSSNEVYKVYSDIIPVNGIANISGGSSGGPSSVNLNSNLLAVWPMEAVSSTDQPDIVGSHTLKHLGSTTQVTNHVQGSYSSAGTYTNIETLFVGTNSFSLAALVYPTASLDLLSIANRWSPDYVWGVYCSGNVPSLKVRYFNDTDSYTATSTVSLTNATWNLVVVTYNNTNGNASISCNGETALVIYTPTGLRTNTSPLQIGNSSMYTDETLYWNRELTQTEINTLWSGWFYTPPSGPTNTPVAVPIQLLLLSSITPLGPWEPIAGWSSNPNNKKSFNNIYYRLSIK